jgi:phospholipid/cholesterol/gamma-HCH transport system permease protein
VTVVADTVRVQSAQASVTVTRRDDGSFLLAFAGLWTVESQRPSLSSVLSQLSDVAAPRAAPGTAPPRVELDGREVAAWDSQFLVFLRKLRGALRRAGAELDTGGLPDGVQRLLALADAAPGAARARAPAPDSLILRIGNGAYDAVASLAAFTDFVGATVIAFWRLVRRRARFPRSDFVVIVQDTGVRALPIVSLIAVLVGLIIAFVGSLQLDRFGAGIFTADMVAIAMLREMGAMMTAVIMAGRTGAAFAAELATMQVNEEIDALSTLGISPMEYLVLPRVLALGLMMPLLCLYANMMGIVGGTVIGVTILDIPVFEYWTRTKNALGFTNLAIGEIKAGIFGGLIALAGCLRGLTAGRSAAAVGVATTSAVVLSIVLIVVFDGIFAVVLNFLGV